MDDVADRNARDPHEASHQTARFEREHGYRTDGHTFVTTVGLCIGGIKRREEPRITLRIKYDVVDGRVDVEETHFGLGSHPPTWWICTDFWDFIDREQYEQLDKLMLQHAQEPMEEFMEESHGARG
mgnify:CR=1 FL=1